MSPEILFVPDDVVASWKSERPIRGMPVLADVLLFGGEEEKLLMSVAVVREEHLGFKFGTGGTEVLIWRGRDLRAAALAILGRGLSRNFVGV